MPDLRPPATDLDATVEELAARVHDAWVEHRQRTGWKYGPNRDDENRTTPSLAPYRELSPAERELDRVSVRATLDGLESLGFRVERDASAAPAGIREQTLGEVDHLIARGLPLPAYDLTKRWLAAHPSDVAFRLRNARALRRCGALRGALSVLEELAGLPDEDGEYRGLLAAVHKETFVRSFQRGDADAGDYLRRAQRLYREVFDESQGKKYWHGINAATLAFVLGEEGGARELAARVWDACEAVNSRDDYWWLATRAEAALVLGRFDVAAKAYRDALKIGGERIGDIGSTRHNALLLLDAYGADAPDRRDIEDALRTPAVIVFAGVPIDRDDTVQPRFPSAIEPRVRAAVVERLEHLQAGFGFSGAEPGAEILFIEAMLERRLGVVNVILPWPSSQYVATHVRDRGTGWLERFQGLLGHDDKPAQVHHVVSASLGVGIDSPVYELFARQLSAGLARIHAEALGTEATGLVVTEGRPGVSTGEIDDLVKRWESIGIRVSDDNVIDLSTLTARNARGGAVARRRGNPAAPARGQAVGVKAILFADVEDYSKIPENRLPTFIEYFVGGIAGRMGVKPYRPDSLRRVGDGLLMVFPNVRDAGLCALDLVEWSAGHSEPGPDGETYWSRLGLPRAMRIRVALHAGPVFECMDPLTLGPVFEGAHINYAARIEPVTPGNQVYASEAFAALAASWPAPCNEFGCEYVGRTSLAKKAGEYPLYHVRRRT